jgi:hypothetical protein
LVPVPENKHHRQIITHFHNQADWIAVHLIAPYQITYFQAYYTFSKLTEWML